MNQFSRNVNRFFYRHNHAGIPHLLLVMAILRLIGFFLMTADRSGLYASYLLFSPADILQGQVWRLFTFMLIPSNSVIFMVLELLFYFFMDRVLEGRFGRLKTNVLVFSCILALDVIGLLLYAIVPATAFSSAAFLSASLDMCLNLALAASVPNAQVLFMMIIPLKMKYLAWLDLFYLIYYSIQVSFPGCLIFVVPILMLLIFFRKDIPELLPDWLRYGVMKRKRKARPTGFQPKKPMQEQKQPYHHKCTVCGRTDVTNPELEFRYCSRCSGYYCYCQDHINNHIHIIDTEAHESKK